MELGKYKKAMRPKKYLTRDFIVYQDPSYTSVVQGYGSLDTPPEGVEMRMDKQAGGVVQREGFGRGTNPPPEGSEEFLEIFLKKTGVSSWEKLSPKQRNDFKNTFPKYQEQQSKIKSKITSDELAKKLGITKQQLKNYRSNAKRATTPGQAVVHNKIVELLGEPDEYRQMIGSKKGGSQLDRVYYNTPTDSDIEIIKSFLPDAKKSNILQYQILNRMKNLTAGKKGDKFLKILETENLSDPDIFKKINKLFPNYTPTEISTAVTRIAQVADGQQFRGVDFIKTNPKLAKKLFKQMQEAPFGNPFATASYKIALSELDKKLKGKDTLNFKTYRKYINDEMKKIGLDPEKFNVDEYFGVSVGGLKEEFAPYSVFSRAMKADLNQKQLAQFQGTLSRYINMIDDQPNKKARFKEIDRINKLIDAKEKDLGVELPRFFKGSAEKAFGKKRYKELTDQGLDFTTSRDYSIKIPKGALTQKEILSSLKSGEGKSNTINQITKDIRAQFGDVLDPKTNKLLTELSNTVSMNPAATKALLLSTVKDLSKIGTKGARFAGAVLIGATGGEILLGLGLEGAMPFMSYLRGEGGKRMLSESFLADFVAKGLNKAGIIDYDTDKLVEGIYASGLKGDRLKAATNVVDQTRRLETIGNFFRESARLNDEIKRLEEQKSKVPAYKHSTLNQRIKIKKEELNKISGELPSVLKAFSDPKNKVTKFGMDALRESVEKFSEAEAFQAGRRLAPLYEYGILDRTNPLRLTGGAHQTLRNLEQIFGYQQNPINQKVVEKLGAGARKTLELEKKLFKPTPEIEDYYGGAMVPTGIQTAPTPFAEGGVVERKGFANGPKIGRRGFLGILAGLIASLKVGSFGGTGKKVTTEVAKKVIKDAPAGTPEWFAPLVDKVMKEGIDAGPTMKTTEREIVKKLEVPSPNSDGALTDTYYVYHNTDTGEIRVDIDAPGVGVNGEEFSLYMRPDRIDGVTDDGLPMIDEGEFFVNEQRATGRMEGPDDYTIELEDATVGLDDSASNWHQVEEFATGKTNKKAEAEQLKKKDYIERNPADDIENRYGPFDDTPPDDYD